MPHPLVGQPPAAPLADPRAAGTARRTVACHWLHLGPEEPFGASLYALIAQPNPSPGEVKRLALRLALDARRPVGGDINRFTWQRTEGGWLIGEYLSVTHRALPFPMSSHLVTDPLVVLVLDQVLVDRPNPYKVLQAIELILGGPPQSNDTLEAAS